LRFLMDDRCAILNPLIQCLLGKEERKPLSIPAKILPLL
jgi:hypothetical protein